MNATKTWVCNARIDVRTLATLMKFYQHQGLTSRKKSTAIRLACEHFKSIITQQYPHFDTPTFQEAVNYLENQAMLDLTEDFTAKYSLVKELQKENLDLDMKRTTKHGKPEVTQDMLDILDKKLREVPIEQEREKED